MSRFQKLTLWLAVIIGFTAYSCKEDIFLPDLEGSLVGYVFTFDEYANLLEDHSGVKVSALGVARVFETHPDAAGRFEFKNLPAGTYELHFEKQGFGMLKHFGVQHLGGKPTTLYLDFSGSSNSAAFFIYQMPTSQIVNLSFENDTLTGTFTFSGAQPESLGLRIYLSGEPDFALEEATTTFNGRLYKLNGNYSSPFYTSELPFAPGQLVYYRARVYNTAGSIYVFSDRLVVGIDTYFDFENNETIYPNLGDESELYSFIFP